MDNGLNCIFLVISLLRLWSNECTAFLTKINKFVVIGLTVLPVDVMWNCGIFDHHIEDTQIGFIMLQHFFCLLLLTMFTIALS